jgi:D-tagatose-1,6-bisphosphate aldolase subunit GatZ/KbaZ
MNNPILQFIEKHKSGEAIGLTSICSSNKFVLEAVIRQAGEDGTHLLIESTSNQVDQFGGYSGMTPDGIIAFIKKLARNNGLSVDQLILGGDHLGPHPWKDEKASQAMDKAKDLIRAYCLAGFTKIHLDTSMHCADDPGDRHKPLDDSIVGERTALLCQVAEESSQRRQKNLSNPVYVIGTEVPIPGGAQDGLDKNHVTRVEDTKNSIEIIRKAFFKHQLQEAWERVIAVVVQPGVEFSDTSIVEYDRSEAAELSRFIETVPGMVYEAHSTDYQPRDKLKQLVEDHFAILKVGPWLTFAFREAVFALALMEEEWLSHRKSIHLSNIRKVTDSVMINQPKYWQQHYKGNKREVAFARRYSYSDRIRYYWPHKEIDEALNRLFQNIGDYPLPLTLISHYLPAQYWAIRDGQISNSPIDIVRDKILEIYHLYKEATNSIQHAHSQRRL